MRIITNEVLTHNMQETFYLSLFVNSELETFEYKFTFIKIAVSADRSLIGQNFGDLTNDSQLLIKMRRKFVRLIRRNNLIHPIKTSQL